MLCYFYNSVVTFFFRFSIGHVFPEFKESDAMFAAERVRFIFLIFLFLYDTWVVWYICSLVISTELRHLLKSCVCVIISNM